MTDIFYAPAIVLPDENVMLFSCFYHATLTPLEPWALKIFHRGHVVGFADRVDAMQFMEKVGATQLYCFMNEKRRYLCSYSLCKCGTKEYPLPESFVVMEIGHLIQRMV